MGGKLEMAWQLGIARENCSMPLIAAGGASPFCVGFILSGVRKLSRSFGTVWLDPKKTKLEAVGESSFESFCRAVTTASGPDIVYDWADVIGRWGQRPPLDLIPLIAAGGPSTFWLDPKSTKKIKGFPKVPWAQGSARLLSARAALSALVTLVQDQSSRFNGRNQGPFQPSGPPSDSKPGWHCRKARRNYESWCRVVPRATAPGDGYERSFMSDSARQSLAPVYERGNYPSLVIARIYGDVSEPIISNRPNLFADWQHTRIAQTYPNHLISNRTLPVQAIDRTPVTLAKNPPWQLRLAPTCPGTSFKAAGAAAALFAYFFQLQGKSMTRGSENVNPSSLLPFAKTTVIFGSSGLFEVIYLSLIKESGLDRAKESETRGSENVNPSSLLNSAVNRCKAPVISPSTIHSKTN